MDHETFEALQVIMAFARRHGALATPCGMGGWRLTRILPKASSARIALRDMQFRYLFQ